MLLRQCCHVPFLNALQFAAVQAAFAQLASSSGPAIWSQNMQHFSMLVKTSELVADSLDSLIKHNLTLVRAQMGTRYWVVRHATWCPFKACQGPGPRLAIKIAHWCELQCASISTTQYLPCLCNSINNARFRERTSQHGALSAPSNCCKACRTSGTWALPHFPNLNPSQCLRFDSILGNSCLHCLCCSMPHVVGRPLRITNHVVQA